MTDFPLNPPDKVEPTHPADERTRDEINANPEGLTDRIMRTRRYFRLVRKAKAFRYARGLDTDPRDMA